MTNIIQGNQNIRLLLKDLGDQTTAVPFNDDLVIRGGITAGFLKFLNNSELYRHMNPQDFTIITGRDGTFVVGNSIAGIFDAVATHKLNNRNLVDLTEVSGQNALTVKAALKKTA